MTDANRKKRNEDRLAELESTFRARLKKVIALLESNGLRPRIQDAWRSPTDQKEAYDSGRSKLLFGFHNITAKDGTPKALAVDLLDDDSPMSPSKSYLLQLAAATEDEGLMTGIRWGIPIKLVKAIDQAIAVKDWNANVKIGWDPTHVQPQNFTVAQAKAGERPPLAKQCVQLTGLRAGHYFYDSEWLFADAELYFCFNDTGGASCASMRGM